MKNIIGIIATIVIVILYSAVRIQAQTETPDTLEIKLSVKSNVIQIDSILTVSKPGDRIRFSTIDSYTFSVIVDNYDQFFETPVSPLIFNVSKDKPVIIIVDTPAKNDTTKIFSVGIINPKKPVPVPPEAPPRIIIR